MKNADLRTKKHSSILEKTASPVDSDRNQTAITVIGLAIWSIVVLLCLAAGVWVIRAKD